MVKHSVSSHRTAPAVRFGIWSYPCFTAWAIRAYHLQVYQYLSEISGSRPTFFFAQRTDADPICHFDDYESNESNTGSPCRATVDRTDIAVVFGSVGTLASSYLCVVGTRIDPVICDKECRRRIFVFAGVFRQGRCGCARRSARRHLPQSAYRDRRRIDR